MARDDDKTEIQANPQDEETRRHLRRERWALLASLIQVTEQPMVVLSFAWVVLIIIDLAQGLGPGLLVIMNLIWLLFVIDFLLKFIIAPSRWIFLRKNWLTGLSIVLPAFRILYAFRFFRLLKLFRAGGAVNMLRLLTSTRRGMQALGHTLGRRGFGYVLAITLLIIFVGAAGMLYFENPQTLMQQDITAEGLSNYGDALWWTAMLMTTMGTGYWPESTEGRLLCWLMSVYAFTVFGYITATIASHFIQSDQHLRDKQRQSSSQSK